MTQLAATSSSGKRPRDEDPSLLPSAKRIDFNCNANGDFHRSISSENHEDMHYNTSQHLQNNGASCQQPSTYTMSQASCNNHHLHQGAAILQHPPPNSSKHLDSSTCTALRNLHLMPGDPTTAEAGPGGAQHDGNQSRPLYSEINRVLRSAHFERLARINGSYSDNL